MPLKQKFSEQWKHVCAHGWWYWIRVAVLIAVGIYSGHKLEERELWTDLRYRAYQWLGGMLPTPPTADHTTVVLINDEEYWLGEPRGREPIQRDYLAKLVEALDAANPAVIALDFDLRSPSPDGQPVEIKEYEAGTQKLCEAVKAVSQRRKVVLPKTIHYKPEQDAFYRESDVYNNCDFAGGRVTVGYIALPDDLRRVPLYRAKVKNGDPVDSFAQAVARAYRPQIVERLEAIDRGDELPYGGFIARGGFDVVTANQLFSREPAVFDKLANRVVIISGEWHSRGLGRGPLADSFQTPVGALPGALLHANYVEALLDKRIYSPWMGWARLALEIFWSLLVALPFALGIRPWQKFLAVAIICGLILLFGYVSLVNMGLFYDFFIPTLLVLAHGVIEQVCEWRAAARKCAREHGPPPGNKSPVPEPAPDPAAVAASLLLAALALGTHGCAAADKAEGPMASPAANSANSNSPATTIEDAAAPMAAPANANAGAAAPAAAPPALRTTNRAERVSPPPAELRRIEKRPPVNSGNVGGPRRNPNRPGGNQP